tara:strand:+ start:218 stop:397 length:180 start_codon:yes stop_codon:yes gene_type:complete
MTHPFWDAIRAREFGRIVDVSSINEEKGQLGQKIIQQEKLENSVFLNHWPLEEERRELM